jgi:hypothetical protein
MGWRGFVFWFDECGDERYGVSEVGKVSNKYVVSSSPYILFKCVRAGYTEIEDSGHDISFTLTNGVYTLGELFGEIGILRNFPTPRIPALTPRLGVCMTFLR